MYGHGKTNNLQYNAQYENINCKSDLLTLKWIIGHIANKKYIFEPSRYSPHNYKMSNPSGHEGSC